MGNVPFATLGNVVPVLGLRQGRVGGRPPATQRDARPAHGTICGVDGAVGVWGSVSLQPACACTSLSGERRCKRGE